MSVASLTRWRRFGILKDLTTGSNQQAGALDLDPRVNVKQAPVSDMV